MKRPVEVSEVVVNESTPAEEEMCFGDKEVLANASAAVIGSPSAPRRTRASRSRRRKKVAAAPEAPASVTSVPFAHVATTCFDVVRMATEEEEVPDQHRKLRSHNEVWKDFMSWEEIPHWRRCHKAKQVSQEPASTPVLFGTQDSCASAMQLSEPEGCSEPSPVLASPPLEVDLPVHSAAVLLSGVGHMQGEQFSQFLESYDWSAEDYMSMLGAIRSVK